MAKEKYNLQEIEAQLEKEPTNPDIWLKKGMALADEKRYEECIIAFSTGLIYDPFHKDLRLQRGRKYTTLDDYRTATAELTLATRLAPENWDTWYYQGVALYLDGRYEQCIKAEKRAIQLTLEDGKGHLPSAVCWVWQANMKLGKPEEAAAILELVDENTPYGNNIDYLERVLLHKGLRDPETFLDLSRLGELDRPELYYMTMCFGMYNYLHYRGEEDKAVAILKEIAAMDHHHETFVYKQTRQELAARGL